MKCLVVYYTRTGNTKKLAEIICEKLGGVLQPIISRKRFRGPWGFLYAGFMSRMKKLPEIEPVGKDIRGYDLVVVGTPVWASTMAAPVRTFLSRYKNEIQRVAFFSTMGGTGVGRTFTDMEEIIELSPINTITLRGREIKRDRYLTSTGINKIEDYIKHLKRMNNR